jgi:death-on-curing protein
LGEAVVLALHGRLLAEHGGAQGIRDSSLLDSALARPRQLLAYGEPDTFDLAAAYTSTFVRNHPFVDGNKGTAFMAAYVLLGSNGFRLVASEVEAAQFVMLLASSEFEEPEFATWLRANCESV